MRVRQSLLISTLIVDADKDWATRNITNIGTINAVAIAAHQARHEPGGGDAMDVDAAVGVGSLRTLGAGAVQAAPGNHTHTLTAEAESGTVTTWTPDDYIGAQGSCARYSVAASGDADPFITKTDTFSALSMAIAGFVGQLYGGSDLKVRIFMGGVQVAESAGLTNWWGPAMTLVGHRALSGSQIVKITIHNYVAAARQFQYPCGDETTSRMHAALIIGSVAI